MGSSQSQRLQRSQELSESDPATSKAATPPHGRTLTNIPPAAAAGMVAAYRNMDVSSTGLVGMHEFHRYFDIAPSAFSFRVFSVIDEDGDGAVSLSDFLSAVYTYGALDASALTRFAFMLYDADVTGYIDATTLRTMVFEMYGARWEANPRVVAVLHEVGWGEKLTYDNFVDINAKFPSLLFPAFTMQSRIRAAVLGEAWWAADYAARAKKRTTAAYSVFDVLHAMEDARVKAGGEEQIAALRERYIPPFLRGRDDAYVPPVHANPTRHAMDRRAMLGLAPTGGSNGGLLLGGSGTSRGTVEPDDKAEGASGPAGPRLGTISVTAREPESASAAAAASTNPAVAALVAKITAGGDMRRNTRIVAHSGTRRTTATGFTLPPVAEGIANEPSQAGVARDLRAARPRRVALVNLQERAARMATRR